MQKNNDYFLVLLGAVGLCFLSYLPIIGHPYFIDDYNFINNANPFSYNHFIDYFLKPANRHYTPLCSIFNDFLFNNFHATPWLIRSICIALFASNVFLLFVFLDTWVRDRKLALLASFFFCLHPIHYMSVNHITSNFVFLNFSFLMLSLITLNHYLNQLKLRNIFLFLSYFFMVCALMTFEGAFLFPLYVVAALMSFKGFNSKTSIKIAVPYLVFSVIYFILWKLIAGSNMGFSYLIKHGNLELSSVVGSYIALIKWYITNLFYPDSIVLIRNIPAVHSSAVLPLIVWATAFLLFCVYIIESKKDTVWHGALLFFLYGFILVVPAMFSHIYMGYVIQPHWLYFASSGFFIFLALTFVQQKSRISVRLMKIFACLLIIAYVGLTQLYNHSTRNEKVLASQWLKFSPNNVIALMILGRLSTEEGAYDKALYYYDRILQTSTYNPQKVQDNIANVFIAMNDLDEAKKHVELALKYDSGYANAYNTLGVIFVKKGELQSAELAFKKAAISDKNLINARLNLCDLLLQTGNYNDAVVELKKFISDFPDYSDSLLVYTKLFKALIESGNFDEFDNVFVETKNKDNAQYILTSIALTLNNSGDFENSSLFLSEAIRIDRYNKEFYLLYGVILANNQYINEAIAIWEIGLNLDSTDQRFIDNLAQAKALLSNQ